MKLKFSWGRYLLSHEIICMNSARTLITVLPKIRFCTMPLINWIHSTSSRFILIISSFLLRLLLPLRFPDQNFASTSHLPNACWMSRQYHSPWTVHSNNKHTVKSRNYGVFHCEFLSILPTLWNKGKSASFMVPGTSCPSSPALNRKLRK